MVAQGTYFPIAGEQYEDANGDPAVNYRIFTYLAGTSTKTPTYTDVALSVANSNPLTLGADARPTIVAVPGVSYKIVFALPGSDDPPASVLWTRDNVSAVPPGSSSADVDVAITAGAGISAGAVVVISDGSGGRTAGRWYPGDAGSTNLSTDAQAIGFANTALTTGSTGTARRMGRVTGLSGLVAGTSYYIDASGAGGLTSTAPTNARLVGVADTTTSLIIVPGAPDASATQSGFVNLGAQTLAGVKTFPAKIIASLGVQFASGNVLQNLIFARKTADFTKNANTTFSDVTDLAFPVEATVSYLFMFFLHERTTAAADWKFQLTGPAAPTALRFGILPGQETSASDASAFSTQINDGGTDGVDKIMVIFGFLRNGANAGTVQLQAAQRTSDATNSVIYAESTILALKLS